jgi:hypothetical protein
MQQFLHFNLETARLKKPERREKAWPEDQEETTQPNLKQKWH